MRRPKHLRDKPKRGPGRPKTLRDSPILAPAIVVAIEIPPKPRRFLPGEPTLPPLPSLTFGDD